MLVVGGLACAIASQPALAQDACAPIITALAETVLAGREGLPPLQARRVGTRAIYLLSRYDDLGPEDIDRMVSDAVTARLQGAEDLDLAWRMHRGTAELSPETLLAVVETSHPSAMRAALLGGEAEAVMATIADLPDGQRVQPGQMAVTVSFDQPDAVKAELGAIAAGQGLDWLAAGFAAAAADPEAWPAQVDGLSEEEQDLVATLWGWTRGFNGNPVPAISTAPDDAEAQGWREATGLVAWAAARQPEVSFLPTVLNMTGAYAEAATAAKLVLKRFDGALSPTGPLDAGWLATLEALETQGFDPDAVRELLGSTTFGLKRVGRENAGDILDWIVAVDALRPYLEGQGELPTDPPALLSSGFTAWDRWLALAQALREDEAGAVGAARAEDLAVLAEMLFAAGSRERLVEMLRAAPQTADSVGLADDFAARTDRLCAAHLWHKGEAPLLGGQALYTFDSAGE